MRKLLALLILAVLGFYVVWPAWSGYRIAAALQAKDEALLQSKIDFPSVRESMRPVVTAEVDKRLSAQGGGAGLLSGDLKTQLLPRLIDGVLQSLVTPANVIRIANDSAGAAKAIEKIITEQFAKTTGGIGAIAGALGGPGSANAGQGGGLGGGLGGVLGNVMGAGNPGGFPALPGGLGGQPAPAAPAADTSACRKVCRQREQSLIRPRQHQGLRLRWPARHEPVGRQRRRCAEGRRYRRYGLHRRRLETRQTHPASLRRPPAQANVQEKETPVAASATEVRQEGVTSRLSAREDGHLKRKPRPRIFDAARRHVADRRRR